MIARILILLLYYELWLNQRTTYEIESNSAEMTVSELISHHAKAMKRIQLSFLLELH